MQAPLCRITFSLGRDSSEQAPASRQIDSEIRVMPGMSTRDVAEVLGDLLGCGYSHIIEHEIRNKLEEILLCGDGVGRSEREDAEWRRQMERVLGKVSSSEGMEEFFGAPSDMRSTSSQKRGTSRYFQISYDRALKLREEDNQGEPQDDHSGQSIYERSLLQKKKTAEKLQGFKRDRSNKQNQQCTFVPRIKQTNEYFTRKNPKFFSSKQDKIYQSTFDKLYKQSFDLREKKKQKLKTMENDQETKLSELSFVPEINECSRQICRMKSYGSFIDLSDVAEQSINKSTSKLNTLSKNKPKQLPRKPKQECTFHPKISENTKKLTQKLPSFYERLELSKQKKPGLSSKSKSQANIIRSKIIALNDSAGQKNIKPNKGNLKKQLYTIQDSPSAESCLLDQQTEKKKFNFSQPQNNHDGVEPAGQKQIQDLMVPSILSFTKKKRTDELFDNRKKTIFEGIFSFLCYKPTISIPAYTGLKSSLKRAKADAEVSMGDISNNPHIPRLIKQLFEPIAEELQELDVSLNKAEFVWALDKLFESLSLSDRGSLLGWGIKLLPEQNC